MIATHWAALARLHGFPGKFGVAMAFSPQFHDHTKPRLVTSNVVCMLSMLLWAIGFPAAEFLLGVWDPLALIAARLSLAVVFLIPLWILLDGPDAVLRARWGRGILVGGIGFGLGTYLILVGQSISDPVTVTIVASSMPAIAALMEVMFDGRRLRRKFVLGLLIAITGGLVAAGTNVGTGSTGLGSLLAFLSVICFAWGSRAAVRDFPELSSIGQTTITLAGAMVFAVVALFFAMQLGLSKGITGPISSEQTAALALYAIGGMALSQILWIMGVGRLGIAMAATHLNAAPFYVMVIMLLLGGMWFWGQAFGALLVGVGVIVAQWRRA